MWFYYTLLCSDCTVSRTCPIMVWGPEDSIECIFFSLPYESPLSVILDQYIAGHAGI